MAQRPVGAMVVSGVSLLTGATSRLATQNGVTVSYLPISDGIETSVQWRQGRVLALEFEFDEGFECERTIALAELPADRQSRVQTLSRGADKVLIEEVFGIDRHYYEAYIFGNGKLTKVDL